MVQSKEKKCLRKNSFTARIPMAVIGAARNHRTESAAAALFLVVLLAPGCASAAVDISALVRLTSNYEYRGYTLSDNHGAAQANVDAAWSNGIFLGGWVSSADFDGASVASNPYLGKTFTLSPDWQLIALADGHFFSGKLNKYKTNYGDYARPDDYNASYGEGTLQLAYRDLGSLQVHVAPDYYGTNETVMAYELELRYPLLDTVEISGGVGYQASHDALNRDALYSNMGIAWFALPNVTLDLRYHDLHEMNERRYDYDRTFSPAYHLDTPVVLSISLGF
jgi:uncharacterized protein (TIGR02001 family)